MNSCGYRKWIHKRSPLVMATQSNVMQQPGEGIVQPLSKDEDQLPRRLHQYRNPCQQWQGFLLTRDWIFIDETTLSVAEAAYIAGIVDGEGTITLTRKHANENRQLAITVSNNERCLLEYLHQVLGAGKITNKRVTRKEHAPHYTYALYNRQALALLQQIYPYLRTYKADRARLILRDYLRLTPRNGYYTHELKAEREKFEAAVLAIKPTPQPAFISSISLSPQPTIAEPS